MMNNHEHKPGESREFCCPQFGCGKKFRVVEESALVAAQAKFAHFERGWQTRGAIIDNLMRERDDAQAKADAAFAELGRWVNNQMRLAFGPGCPGSDMGPHSLSKKIHALGIPGVTRDADGNYRFDQAGERTDMVTEEGK